MSVPDSSIFSADIRCESVRISRLFLKIPNTNNRKVGGNSSKSTNFAVQPFSRKQI